MSKKQEEILSKSELTDNGERGRYHDALQQGHTVRIHEDDGTTTIHYYQLEEGAVLLDPDVREFFPDAKAVNTALRSLIALIPTQSVIVIAEEARSPLHNNSLVLRFS